MTGRAKQQAAKAQVKEVSDRAEEVAMADAQERNAQQTGIWDPQSGERVDTPTAARTVVVEDPPERGGFFQSEPVLTGQEDPADVPTPVASKRAFTQPPVEVARSTMATIRVDADIEDMTYGMRNGEPNNFTFKEGVQYRVPLPVAEHLNERGLIRQWIS
jgi:hypothetical protein